jgi:membrane fusion protein (multidrug efflux system)
MDDKRPIPVPPAQRWREFRIQFLPFVIFILLVLAVALLWKRVVTPVNMVGEVVGTQYQVRTLIDGTLTDLKVDTFGYVQKGEEIGRMTTMEPALLQAELDAAAADLEVAQIRTGFSVEQNMIRLRQLRLDRDLVQSQLEIKRVDLRSKKATFEVQKQLFEKKLTTELAFDQAKTAVDVDLESISQMEKQLAAYNAAVTDLETTGLTTGSQSNVLTRALQAKTNQIIIAHKPITLKAPADGIITSVTYRPGEKVRAGESVVTVASTNAPYIIGYIRQPMGYVPKVNEEILVRTRTMPRVSAPARVLQVGTQVDFINPAIVTPDNTRKDKALSLKISTPPELGLRPGEYVDLLVTRR